MYQVKKFTEWDEEREDITEKKNNLFELTSLEIM